MKNNKLWLGLSIVNSLLFFSVLFSLNLPTVYSQANSFLSPPYFGRTTVNSVFDHEYPLYGFEDDNGFNGDIGVDT